MENIGNNGPFGGPFPSSSIGTPEFIVPLMGGRVLGYLRLPYWDYTIRFYGDYKKPLQGSLLTN